MKPGTLPSRKSKQSRTRKRIIENSLIVFACVCALLGFAPTALNAQTAPICDVTCTPDPTSSSYAGAAAARPKMLNERGYSSPTVARASLHGADAGANGSNDTVIGSQSYNYTIPILRMPGRAGVDLVLNLYYNSRIWDVDTIGGTVTFNADRDYPSYGFRLDFGYAESAGGGFIVTDGDGAKHALPPNGSVFDSTDGTYMEYNAQTNILTYKNGKSAQFAPFPSDANLFRPVSIKDTNGNYISIAYVAGHDQLISTITDTVGRVINFNYDPVTNQLASITQAVSTGTKTYVTFTWAKLYGAVYNWYNFSSLTVNAAPDLNTQLNVLTGCSYANGTGYKFTYGDWGIISEIDQLSSTGTTRRYISYNYPLASAGGLSDAPSYTQQTISPDGTSNNTSVWQYSTTKNGTGIVTSTAITDPNSNTNTINLDPNTGLMSSTLLQDSSSKTLKTVNYSWTTSDGGTVPATIQTTNEAGQVSSIQYGYDLKWASYGQPTSIQEVDFDGTVKRTTQIAYSTGGTLPGNSAATPYIDRHILGLPFNIVVTGASGAKSRTDFGYDFFPLTSVPGAANHDDANYGTSVTVRGNLSEIIRAAGVDVHNNPTGNGAQSVTNYDTLGNVINTSVDCCTLETLNFSSTTQYSAPDSIVRGPTSGPQFTTSYTYDPDNNLLLTSTDENGQVTQYQYDSMNRTTQVILPPQNGTHVQLNTSYGDDTASPTVTRTTTADNSGTVTLPVSVTTLDGLGHVMQVDTKNGSTVISTVKYGYDKLWQRTQASNPYAPGDTVANTAFAYDGLGRVTQVTPPSAGNTQYQYFGNVVTITDPAGKQRINHADALGRLIEVDEPGESFAGIHAKGSIDIGQIKGIATPAKGSVTINTGTNGEQCTQGVCQTGTVSISFNNSTETDTASFGSGDTTNSIATNLAAAINNCGHSSCYATATSSGATVSFTTTGKGSADNSQVNTAYTTDTTAIWSAGSAQTSPNTTANYLLGGQLLNGAAPLVSPNGRFALTMLLNQNLVLYDRSTGNPGNIIWQSNTANVNHTDFVQMGTNGNLVLYRSTSRFGTPIWSTNTAGATGAYYLAVQNDGNVVVYKGFPQSSFTVSPTQQTMTGGTDAGLVDHGTVTMTAGSFTSSAVPYGPGTANTTGTQVATALASALSVGGSGVTATSSGTVITVTATTPGVAGNSVSVGVHPTSGDPTDFPTPSFSVSPVNLSGGVDPYSSGFTHSYVTTYTYDGMNNPIGVSQAAGNVNDQPITGQPRTYTYDSMGRLTQATTPESGTVNTFYTNTSGSSCSANPFLPCRVQDARGVTKTLTYDGINRLTGAAYSDGTTPGVSYAYDTGGAAAFALTRVIKITEGSNSQTLSYDNLGRTISVSQIVDGTPYLTQYGYNLASQLTSITYPTGRLVTQNVDAIGRLSSISDSSPTTYLNNLSYNAAGETLALTLGNQVQGAFTYNDHLQISSLRYFKTGASSDALNLSYDYTTGAPGNNGQIQAAHFYTSPGTEDATKSEYFVYDPFARLSAAHTGTVNSTPGTWSLQWIYDRLGNRLSQTLVGGNVAVGQPQLTIDPNTNRITNTGFQYDAAGNMTNDAVNAYSYDGANRLTQINSGSATYTYFGLLRIKKVAGSATTVFVYSGGKPIVEYLNGSVSKEYVYASSTLLATIAGSSLTYHHPDHISNRAETDSNGNGTRSYGHFPYGETWYETGTPDKWKFTTFERDSLSGETGLDYAQSRYYSSGLGRFMSADPVGGMLDTPQSIDRYVYVGGDPVSRVDPLGLLWGSEALCMLDSQGNFTNVCAKLGGGPPDGSDNDLFGTGAGVGSIACSGSVFGGPTSFCSTVPGCPVFEIFMCSGFGTATSVLGPTWTNPPSFTLGPTFKGSTLPLSPFSPGPDPTGTGKACDIVTWTEVGCDAVQSYRFNGDILSPDFLTLMETTYIVPFNTYNPPPIPPRGPFVPPPPPAPPSRLP